MIKKLKREPGSSGPLIYAMCFVSLVTVMYFFTMMQYRAKLHVLKDEMETNLHIIENYCLTVNQRTEFGEDLFERERERAHIVTVGVFDQNATENERKAQAYQIGKAFEERFKAEFYLYGGEKPGVSPAGGVLAQMTNHASDNKYAEMHIESLTIFEPTYVSGDVFPVYCGNDRHNHIEDCKHWDKCPLPDNWGTLTPNEQKRWTKDGTNTNTKDNRIPTGFWTVMNTSGWWVYDFKFDENNSLQNVVAYDTQDAPEVMGFVFGQTHAEGATIQATISAKFKKPFGFWGEYFAGDDPFQNVSVSEGIDIVYSTDDSRKK